MRPVIRIAAERLVVIFCRPPTDRLTVTFVDLRTGAFDAGRLMRVVTFLVMRVRGLEDAAALVFILVLLIPEDR